MALEGSGSHAATSLVPVLVGPHGVPVQALHLQGAIRALDRSRWCSSLRRRRHVAVDLQIDNPDTDAYAPTYISKRPLDVARTIQQDSPQSDILQSLDVEDGDEPLIFPDDDLTRPKRSKYDFVQLLFEALCRYAIN